MVSIKADKTFKNLAGFCKAIKAENNIVPEAKLKAMAKQCFSEKTEELTPRKVLP